MMVMLVMKKKMPRLKLTYALFGTFVPSEGGSTREPCLMDKEPVFVRNSDLLYIDR